MRCWLTMLSLALAALPRTRAVAAAPTGHVDAPNAGQPQLVGGWARDSDFAGPIPVHIYIDGHLAHATLAGNPRPDLPFADQNHGYHWVPPLLGPGTHQVIVYGIGVNSAGQPDGENPGLPGSPATIAQGCKGFTGAAAGWCQGVPSYYEHRAADTRYLYNDNLRVGVSPSYGGTIFELYAADHSFNVITEHGGGAVQLSVWGYEPKGPDAFFANGLDVCAPQAFATEAACKAAGHASCRLWCCSQGAHVANCSTVRSCVDWGAGAPFNPIQAQAAGCGWDSPTNDVDEVTVSGPSVFVRKSAPYHFTKSTSMPGMVFEQTTTAEPSHVRVDYRISYAGPHTLAPHPQEIPAVFPGTGMNHTYHFYDGPTPYQSPGAPVRTVVQPPNGLMLRVPNRSLYPHGDPFDGYLAETWISVCDAAQEHCLTAAFFSPQIVELNAAGYPGSGYGYLTPLGAFAIAPGMDEKITVYLFPYRHDQTVAGKTVREHIRDLAAASGCLAHGFPCDDGYACTTDDRCQGNGTCAGAPGACGDAGPPPRDAGPASDGARPVDGAAVARDRSSLPLPGRDAGVGGDRGGPPPGMQATGGCACELPPRRGPAAHGLLLFGLAALAAARRGRRRRGAQPGRMLLAVALGLAACSAATAPADVLPDALADAQRDAAPADTPGDRAPPDRAADAAAIVSPTEYCERTAASYCRFYLRCGRIAVDTQQACETAFVASCNERYEPVYAALVAAGLLELSAAGIARCAAHLDQVPCAQQIRDLDGACGEMWRGRQPPGQPCGLGIESLVCAPDSACVLTLELCGTCTPTAKEGDPCGTAAGTTCGSNAECTAGRCRARALPGEACGETKRCVIGARCEGNCVAPAFVGEGASCDGANRCQYLTACVGGRCLREVATGELCDDNSTCGPGRCADEPPRVCAPRLTAGAQCASPSDCLSGSCNADRCDAIPGHCFAAGSSN